MTEESPSTAAESESTPTPRATAPPAWTCSRAWIILLLSIIIGIVLDLGSKHLVFEHLGPNPVTIDREQVIETDPAMLLGLIPEESRQPVTIVPNLLDFQLVLNSGAVFGTGSGKRWFFVGFTIVALIFAFFMFALWTRRTDRLTHIAIGLVISGGIGNLYDRIRFACVRDFIHPLPDIKLPFGISWPGGERDLWPYVSNVADALLLIGIFILMVYLWRNDPKRNQSNSESS